MPCGRHMPILLACVHAISTKIGLKPQKFVCRCTFEWAMVHITPGAFPHGVSASLGLQQAIHVAHLAPGMCCAFSREGIFASQQQPHIAFELDGIEPRFEALHGNAGPADKELGVVPLDLTLTNE